MGLQPIPNAIQYQGLVFEKHETHAEKNIVEEAFCRGLIGFYGLVVSLYMIFQPLECQFL